MNFYGILFLLLAMFTNAQDDNPTGDDVGVPQVPQRPTVPQVSNIVDDNPSPSDVIEGKVNVTTTSTTSTPTPTQKSDSSLQNSGIKTMLNGMYIFAMMFML